MVLKHTLIACAFLWSGMAMTPFLTHNQEIHANRPLSEFPRTIGEWRGDESRFDQEVYDLLGVDDSFLATYRHPSGKTVQLYIGFYQSQREGDIIHSPRNCMPGAGWKITRTDYRNIARPYAEEPSAKVIEMTLSNGRFKQAMLYWFHSRGRIISSEYWQKIYLIVDSVLRHRTDGSFVRLIAPMPETESPEAFAVLEEFAEQLFPILDDYLPS